MVGFGGYFLYFIPVSSISVDVNPSIELGINRFDKVVTVDTFNNDGYHIMSSLNVRFMSQIWLIVSPSISSCVTDGSNA